MYKQRDGKIVTCELCGQVGLPVINRGDSREKHYVCKEPEPCHRRQEYAKTNGTLCSYWFCTSPMEVECSCGMKLCKQHKFMVSHVGHKKTKIVDADEAPVK